MTVPGHTAGQESQVAPVRKLSLTLDCESAPALGKFQGIGVQGKAGTLKSPTLENSVRNLGVPVVGWGGACRISVLPWTQVGETEAQRGELQEERCQLGFPEGKLRLEEAFCLPALPSPTTVPTLGLRGCGLPAWVWWSEAMVGGPVEE